MDFKGEHHSCDSLEALTVVVREDGGRQIDLIWSPSHPRMQLPEELDGMASAVRAARDHWTREDLTEASDRLRWASGLLFLINAYAFYSGFRYFSQAFGRHDLVLLLGYAAKTMLFSTATGLSLLAFLIFALIPWYQARKRRREMPKWTEGSLAETTPTLRFEAWLERQKAPFTFAILGLISLVGLAQLLPSDGLAAAGLVKDRYLHGEWWRLLTAPFLHGNVVHFFMNATGLLYLGKRLEVFARWPHLILVFLFSALVGGEASARLLAAPSVGASGGLMGWLGFLFVFETLHKNLVPRRARRRLLAGVAMTALIGLIGYRYIDNAAHAGGLIAGMTYAAIVFPSSSSPHRPQATMTDRIVGGLALGILALSAGLAFWKCSGGG
jgi:membrane associated rhomboid family serine protease